MDVTDLFDSESIESADLRMDFERYMKGLKARDAQVLYLWVEGYTQAEIGRMFGFSQQRISQILANISKSST